MKAANVRESESSASGASAPQVAGLVAQARRRKHDSRGRLLRAGLEQFCERGYVAVSVEEIAAAARVSRITFYRRFSSKLGRINGLDRI